MVKKSEKIDIAKINHDIKESKKLSRDQNENEDQDLMSMPTCEILPNI